MEKRTNEDKSRKIGDRLVESYVPSALPIGPDGGLDASLLPPPLPKLTSFEKRSLCAQGPCRHYWRLKRPVFELVEGTIESLVDPDTGKPLAMLNEYSHTCLVQLGMEFCMEDDSVLDCNLWDPLTPAEVMRRARARERFFYGSWWQRFKNWWRKPADDEGLPPYPPQQEETENG